jgi:hypothetical protein
VSDINDRPAVPPMDTGADERYGFLLAGAILLLLGWGLLLLVNVALHLTAPSSGTVFGPVHVYPSFGPYAWTSAIFGVGTGLVGLALLYFGWSSPKGKFVLPGQPY